MFSIYYKFCISADVRSNKGGLFSSLCKSITPSWPPSDNVLRTTIRKQRAGAACSSACRNPWDSMRLPVLWTMRKLPGETKAQELFRVQECVGWSQFAIRGFCRLRGSMLTSLADIGRRTLQSPHWFSCRRQCRHFSKRLHFQSNVKSFLFSALKLSV